MPRRPLSNLFGKQGVGPVPPALHEGRDVEIPRSGRATGKGDALPTRLPGNPEYDAPRHVDTAREGDPRARNSAHLGYPPGVRRVALFGGSFDPPHVGHVMVVAWLLATERADEVWLIPVGTHALGKRVASFADRVAMAKAAVATLRSRVRVDEIEGEREGVTSYTIDTVEALRARHVDTRFALVVGSDILLQKHQWKEFDRLVTLAELLVVRRDGVAGSETVDPDDPTPLFPEVSSTEVRARLARGARVDGLVPAAVLEIVRDRKLYRDPV